MIDLHSHILPNIDDGSKSISETYNLIKEAYNAGFTNIISTSHYLEDYDFIADDEQRRQWISLLSQNLPEEVKNIKLHIGSEIYIRYDMLELLENKKASTLGDSNYVLFELSMKHKTSNLKNIIYDLLEQGYIPIIAHPERYKFIQEEPNYLIELIELGVYFQANFASIIGFYGKEVQNTVKLLLKNNMIHFLGSDVHRENTIYTKMPEILKELRKIISENKLKELTELNPKLVLENKKIYVDSPIEIKKSFWNKL